MWFLHISQCALIIASHWRPSSPLQPYCEQGLSIESSDSLHLPLVPFGMTWLYQISHLALYYSSPGQRSQRIHTLPATQRYSVIFCDLFCELTSDKWQVSQSVEIYLCWVCAQKWYRHITQFSQLLLLYEQSLNITFCSKKVDVRKYKWWE